MLTDLHLSLALVAVLAFAGIACQIWLIRAYKHLPNASHAVTGACMMAGVLGLASMIVLAALCHFIGQRLLLRQVLMYSWSFEIPFMVAGVIALPKVNASANPNPTA
jgi:hypothetical protein